jgi:hypothetical protein
MLETMFGRVVLCSGDGVAEDTRALMSGQRVNAGLRSWHVFARIGQSIGFT